MSGPLFMKSKDFKFLKFLAIKTGPEEDATSGGLA